MFTLPTITIEETVQKLFAKYILIYPYTSFYHYFKFIKNSSNNNEEKKSIILIFIENKSTEIENNIENCVLKTLKKMFFKMNSPFEFDSIKFFFDIIAENIIKCALYVPGDKLVIDNDKFTFRKFRDRHDGETKFAMSKLPPMINTFFSRIYYYFFPRGSKNVATGTIKKTNYHENYNNNVYQEKDTFYYTFSSYVATENSSEFF
jgi:hypothetical protein